MEMTVMFGLVKDHIVIGIVCNKEVSVDYSLKVQLKLKLHVYFVQQHICSVNHMYCVLI